MPSASTTSACTLPILASLNTAARTGSGIRGFAPFLLPGALTMPRSPASSSGAVAVALAGLSSECFATSFPQVAALAVFASANTRLGRRSIRDHDVRDAATLRFSELVAVGVVVLSNFRFGQFRWPGDFAPRVFQQLVAEEYAQSEPLSLAAWRARACALRWLAAPP